MRHARLPALLALAVAAGCATPSARIDDAAGRFGFDRKIMQGAQFTHVVYVNAVPDAGRTLHVYIEGDGRPYVDRYTVARDPTPSNPVMLKLMALDDAPSAYLGRPCYFGLHTTTECSPIQWTIGRFGEDVVASMTAAAERLRARTGSSGLVLIGHSGGAAVATLMAQRLPNVRALITIGGTLDTAAWTELHGYAPLRASLNPSAAPLEGVPTVLHLVGSGDTVTPPRLVSEAASRIGDGRVEIVDDADHTCCWEHVWPTILSGIP